MNGSITRAVLIGLLSLNAILLGGRFVQEMNRRAEAATVELILDNGQPGTSFVGTWQVSGAPSPFGTDSLWSKTVSHSYRYSIQLPSAGQYDVYAWWTQLSSRTTAARYEIGHSGGTAAAVRDQTAGGGQWNLLGTWSFGASATVTIRPGPNGSTSADAVRVVQRQGLELTPEEKEILSHLSIVYENAGTYCLDPHDGCDGPSELAKTIRLSGANFQIVNGEGITQVTNGLGNLIIGYHEERGEVEADSCTDAGINVRSGSHNLVVGSENNYSSYGGAVIGIVNSIANPASAVTGGAGNRAWGRYSHVGGGFGNYVLGRNSAIVGGRHNAVFEANTAIAGGTGQDVGEPQCVGPVPPFQEP